MFAVSRPSAFLTLTLTLPLCAPATAQTYKIDDGTPGPSLTYGLPDDFCWLNLIDVGAATTLTSIEAILGDAPDGSPVTFCVWRDPNGFGQPWDGILLVAHTTTVRNSGDLLLTEYAIPPTTASGKLFVGAFVTTDGTLSPATMDPHQSTLGRAWFCVGYGPGTFDPATPGLYSWYSPPTIGYQGVFMLRANGPAGPTPETRCVAKTNSQGCTPTLSYTGTCSASASNGFVIRADGVLNRKPGIFVYSLAGLDPIPFAGGTLCLATPLRRTFVLDSGGSPSGVDCSGSYSFDFNAWIATGKDSALVAGVTVDGMFWSRDPFFSQIPERVGLTEVLHFGIAP